MPQKPEPEQHWVSGQRFPAAGPQAPPGSATPVDTSSLLCCAAVGLGVALWSALWVVCAVICAAKMHAKASKRTTTRLGPLDAIVEAELSKVRSVRCWLTTTTGNNARDAPS